MLEYPWMMLLIGVVAGWLLKWVIYDLIILRPRLNQGSAAIAKIEDYDRLTARVNDQKKLIEELIERNAETKREHAGEIERLKADLEYAQSIASERIVAEASGAQSVQVSEEEEVEVVRDSLQMISGVGPDMENQFWSAGIYRFSQLAALSQAQIADIIKPASRQNVDPYRWIRDATRLAAGE